jgi:uncharacterized membrane protein HdeD (DUF308 family)
MTNTDMSLGAVGEIKEHATWFIVLGVVFIIGGVFAIAMPLAGTLVATLAVGWALIFVGVLDLIQSWSTKNWGGFIWQLVIGLIILVGGIAVLIDPIVAALTLTLLVGVIFIAKGVVQLVLGFQFRPNANWGWIVAAGVLAVVLGLMILAQWPLSGAWVLGTLVGISLIFSGWSYVMIAIAARNMPA